nr:protein kinase [Endozoicomonas sp.]
EKKQTESVSEFGHYDVAENRFVKRATEPAVPQTSSGAESTAVRLRSVTDREPVKTGLFTIPDGFEPKSFSDVQIALAALLPIFCIESFASGTFSTVWRGQKTDSNFQLAIKIIADNGCDNPSVGLTQGEICALSIPDHASLSRTHAILLKEKKGDKYCLLKSVSQIPEDQQAKYFVKAVVSDYLEGRELFKFMMKTGSYLLPAKHLLPLFRKITNGVRHLKRHGYIHRDIKTENIIFNDGKNQAWLIDYSFVKKVEQNGTTTPKGTYLIRAPEIFDAEMTEETYSYECDCWSLGCLFMCALTGYYPCDYNPFTDEMEYSDKQSSKKNRDNIKKRTKLFARLEDDKKIVLLRKHLPQKHRGFRLELLNIAVQLLRLDKITRMNLDGVVNKLSQIKTPEKLQQKHRLGVTSENLWDTLS